MNKVVYNALKLSKYRPLFHALRVLIIGAGAVVLSNQTLEPGVYAGIPAKKVKDASEAVAEAAHKNAQGYMLYKDWYKD